MICPKCGEVNSNNFLFCGMCGTILEPARKATAAVTPPQPPPKPVETQPAVSHPAPLPPAPPAPPRVTVSEPTPSLNGPSLLGLGQSDSVDSLRDRAFSGLASYGSPDEPKGSGKEILLTVLLVAALAGAGWWTYKNYIGIATTRKVAPPTQTSESANPAAEDAPAKPVEKSEVKDVPVLTRHAPETTGSSGAAEPAVPTSATPDSPESEAESVAKTSPPAPMPARHEVSATRIPEAKPAPPAADSGDALFRRGEGYLYGRNGAEDCANALKYLKMAADKQHAKARSMMGTMYATGHCVSRDLPSSYRWFALALRVDPNNPILEKDLSAVWNQMTPPERQLATRSQ